VAAIKPKDPDISFWNRKNTIQASGSDTENLSEVLSQVCLGFSLVYGRSIHWSDLVQVGADGYPELNRSKWPIIKPNWLVPIVKDKLKLPSGSPLGRTGMSDYAKRLISWSLQRLGGKHTWLSATARNMAQLRSNMRITGQYRVWNDKAIMRKPFSPYKAYDNTRTGVDSNKWNPADIWIMNREGEQILQNIVRAKWGLPQFNTALINAYKSRKIIPVSLKKPQSGGYHETIMNTDEYYHRIVIGKTHDPTIEFTDDNKDCKINFTIETIELPKGWTADKADRNPFSIPSNAQVVTSQNVRLKYKTSGNQLELEFTTTGGGSVSAARGGKMGTGNIRDIIGNTSQQGVNRVRTIQRNYQDRQFQTIDNKGNPKLDNNGDPIMEDFDLQNPDWYSTNQMGKSDPRKNLKLNVKNQDLHNLFSEYVHALWEEIARTTPNAKAAPMLAKIKDKYGRFGGSNSEKGLNNVKDLWYKARAGEVGLAVGGVTSGVNRRRLIQNLYDVAGSVAYRTGLTKAEKIVARQTGDMSGFKINTTRKVKFKAGPFIKVY